MHARDCVPTADSWHFAQAALSPGRRQKMHCSSPPPTCIGTKLTPDRLKNAQGLALGVKHAPRPGQIDKVGAEKPHRGCRQPQYLITTLAIREGATAETTLTAQI